MLHPKQQFIKDIYGKEPETLDEIAEACIAVISAQGAPVVGFAWNISYNPRVSNSHSAPIAGYQNFGGDRGSVRSYPGMSGRVWIRYAKDPDFMRCSDNFAKTLTYTGTGGGGSYDGLWKKIATAVYQTDGHSDRGRSYPIVRCYSWDYRIFLSDFPKFDLMPAILAHEDAEEKRKIWHQLQKQYYSRRDYTLDHSFQWEDPTVKAADEKFIAAFERMKEAEPS